MSETTFAFFVVAAIITFWALMVWIYKRHEAAPAREAVAETADYVALALSDLARHPRPIYYGAPDFQASNMGPFWRIATLVGETNGVTLVRVEYATDPNGLFLAFIVSARDWGRFIEGREPLQLASSLQLATEHPPAEVADVLDAATRQDMLLDEIARQDADEHHRRIDLAIERNGQTIEPGPGLPGRRVHFRHLNEYLRWSKEHRQRVRDLYRHAASTSRPFPRQGPIYFGRFHSSGVLAGTMPPEPLYWQEGVRGPGTTVTIAFAPGPLGPWCTQIVEKSEWDRFVAAHADRLQQLERDSIPYRPKGGPDA